VSPLNQYGADLLSAKYLTKFIENISDYDPVFSPPFLKLCLVSFISEDVIVKGSY
jgi:hypothetical protein